MKTLKTPFDWTLAHGRGLVLGQKSLIMGVLNVTPDSFSDGGSYTTADSALAQAVHMVEEGADILDIGGESTRPGAAIVTEQQEIDRVIPVIENIASRLDIAISIDTYRAGTARAAVAAGAHIVNDVWGLQREPHIAQVAKDTGAGLVIMHTSREREPLPDVIADQVAFLTRSLEIAEEAGVSRSQIVLDPGFGFGKETEESNVELMARLDELETMGYPWLIGTSRKRFLGTITGRPSGERDLATAITSAILRLKGGAIFRVHDVRSTHDALAIADAVLALSPDHSMNGK